MVINVKDNDVRLMWSDIGISENIYSAIGICTYQVFWNGQEPRGNGNNLHYFLEYLRTRFWLLIFHSLPLVAFYTLWNHKKTRVFLVFSRSIERDRWHKIWYFCSSTFSANWERRDKTRTTTKGKVNSSIREKLFIKINVKGSTIFYFQQKSVHHNFYYVKFSFIVLAIQCYGRWPAWPVMLNRNLAKPQANVSFLYLLVCLTFSVGMEMKRLPELG